MSAPPTAPGLRYTSYGSITRTRRPPSLHSPPEGDASGETGSSPSFDGPRGTLQRGLSARQVQMIAIAGTIGTGLFLGTGRSLAQGGPAGMLICHSIVSLIVYVTLLLLGEMATQYPIAGECFSVSLAMFAGERSCASMTFPSYFILASIYECNRVNSLHFAIWEPI